MALYLPISYNQDVNLANVPFDILGIQSSENIQNVVVNFVDILHQLMGLRLFAEISQQYLRFQWMVGHCRL
jgi:hypothetical protein